MNKTKIEWCDYTINPVKGLCPMACSYCYARRMYLNPYYKNMYKHQEVRFDWSVANDLGKMKAGSKVFWGSTMELFGDWVDPEWMRLIFEAAKRHHNLTHIFLTKQPQNLIKWSPFPNNCWVGVSAIEYWKYVDACNYLSQIKAKVKFISFEPLLSWDKKPQYFFNAGGINWLIIGQQTPPSEDTEPKIEWIREIVEAADRAKIPVFLKDNLEFLLGYPLPEWAEAQSSFVRQEFPRGVLCWFILAIRYIMKRKGRTGNVSRT